MLGDAPTLWLVAAAVMMHELRQVTADVRFCPADEGLPLPACIAVVLPKCTCVLCMDQSRQVLYRRQST